MSAQPSHRPSEFVWRELITADPRTSLDFYEALTGWRVDVVDSGGRPYHMLHAGELPVAGIFSPEGADRIKAHWSSYVSVPDVDAAVAAAEAAGGQVVVPALDLKDVGRFATLRDPQGAVLSVFHGTRGDAPRRDRPGCGEFCWEQLDTHDLDGAKAFYRQVFGWAVEPFAGTELEVFTRGEVQVASLMRSPEGAPTAWFTYLVVRSLDQTQALIPELGGRVLVERIPVPRVGHFAVVQDPAGAVFCAFEGEKG